MHPPTGQFAVYIHVMNVKTHKIYAVTDRELLHMVQQQTPEAQYQQNH